MQNIDRLLRDGWSIDNPNTVTLEAAARLERLGLVDLTHREFVVCAEPLDADYPPMVRDCQGHVFLQDGLDEGDDEYRCLDCERPVYPFLHDKRRHGNVRSRIRLEGVISFIREELNAIGDFRQMTDGVFRVETGSEEVLVCLVEMCRDSRYLSREHARLNPTLFVAVDSRNLKERFLPDPWLVRVSLADLVTGTADLPFLLDDVLAKGVPSVLVNASLPVYNKVVPTLVHTPEAGPQRRLFMVECGPDRLLIEDALVVTAKADVQLQVFGVLWRRFLEDLSAVRAPDDFRHISLKDLTNIIDEGDRDDAIDELNVRRAINRLQNDMTETVRRELGLPIKRDDIIQNIRSDGQRRKGNGYRINPRMVLPRVSSPS